MSLLLVEAFAEVVKYQGSGYKVLPASAKTLPTKSRDKVYFHRVTSLFAAAKNAEIRGLQFLRILAKSKLYRLLITLERVKQKTIFLSLISWTRTGNL